MCAGLSEPDAVDFHAVMIFLFAQLYVRQAQRPEAMEVWPQSQVTPPLSTCLGQIDFLLTLDGSTPSQRCNPAQHFKPALKSVLCLQMSLT